MGALLGTGGGAIGVICTAIVLLIRQLRLHNRSAGAQKRLMKLVEMRPSCPDDAVRQLAGIEALLRLREIEEGRSPALGDPDDVGPP
jgi:shikimate 5-dehydrogenase